jgi:hypothetical protein
MAMMGFSRIELDEAVFDSVCEASVEEAKKHEKALQEQTDHRIAMSLNEEMVDESGEIQHRRVSAEESARASAFVMRVREERFRDLVETQRLPQSEIDRVSWTRERLFEAQKEHMASLARAIDRSKNN